MFRILARSARTGIVTDPRPLAPRLRPGFPAIAFERCTACDDCARACPTGAIQVGPGGASIAPRIQQYRSSLFSMLVAERDR